MVQLSYLFIAASLVASGFASPAKRTVAQVEADIATITSQVNALDTQITGFPASGLTGALAIHSAAGTLETALSTGTSDVKSTGSLSEADGTTVLNSVSALSPTILDSLSQLTAKKASFAALPIAGIPALVLADLQALNASTGAFSAALIASAPADQVATATSLQNGVIAAFNTAIAAYE
ncbi:hydrophobic surface binding protein, partial [Roridomyces roridus]